MKRFIPALLLLFSVPAFSADINPTESRPGVPGVYINTNLKDRLDGTYAPTYNVESNFSYAQSNATSTVKTSAGLLHSVVISSGVTHGGGFIVYDSTTTTDLTRPIAKFENGTGTEGTYLFDVQVTSGIQVMSPASSTEWTITYR